MSPITLTLFAQSNEISIIPMLAKIVKVKDMTDTTAPVSPFCCSSIKLEVGGRVTLPANVAGNNDNANNIGL